MELLKVKVADFEGPFDLLLHLIRKNKMDIYSVEIYKITNQYIDYINKMKEMDLEITSEFIVIAASLIEIKSKKLLPKIKIEDENEEDIEKKLLQKLVEYKLFKQASVFFKDRHLDTGEVYSKKAEIIEDKRPEVSNEDLLKNITLLELYKVYNRVLEEFKEKQNIENVIQRKVYVDKFKIEDKMEYLRERLLRDEIINFKFIIKECEYKMEKVVIFLATLELIKLRAIKVYQEDNFGDILIKRIDEEN